MLDLLPFITEVTFRGETEEVEFDPLHLFWKQRLNDKEQTSIYADRSAIALALFALSAVYLVEGALWLPERSAL